MERVEFLMAIVFFLGIFTLEFSQESPKATGGKIVFPGGKKSIAIKNDDTYQLLQDRLIYISKEKKDRGISIYFF